MAVRTVSLRVASFESDAVRPHDPITAAGRAGDPDDRPPRRRRGDAGGFGAFDQFLASLSSSSDSRATSLVRSCFAVARASRSSQVRRPSKTTMAALRSTSSSAACSRASSSWFRDVGVYAAGGPICSRRPRASRPIPRHVVRVDLGPDAIEEDASFAPDRRVRGGAAGPATERSAPSTTAPRYWLRAASPRSATSSEAASTSRHGGAAHRRPIAIAGLSPKSAGKIRRHVSGSVRSPFIAARAISRSAEVAFSRRAATRATSGSGLDARIDDGPGIAGGVLEISSTAPEHPEGRILVGLGRFRTRKWRPRRLRTRHERASPAGPAGLSTSPPAPGRPRAEMSIASRSPCAGPRSGRSRRWPSSTAATWAAVRNRPGSAAASDSDAGHVSVDQIGDVLPVVLDGLRQVGKRVVGGNCLAPPPHAARSLP